MNTAVDSKDNRTTDDFIRDLTKILLLKELHIHTRRAIVYKAIQDFSKLIKNSEKQYWSLAVKEEYKKNRLTGCTFEHVIPISLFTNLLAPLDTSALQDIKKRSDEDIHKLVSDVFENWVTVCWVSRDENDKLNRTSVNKLSKPIKKFKNNMPENWGFQDNLWARYEHDDVGIKYEKIPTELIEEINKKRRKN